MAAPRAVTFALASIIVSLWGCALEQPAQPTLQIGATGTMTHLDPARGSEPATVVFARYVFRTLPEIATSVKSSASGQRWTFTIPDGLHFSDGTTLDAPAVAANFERWRLGWYDDDGYVGYAKAFLDPKRPDRAIARVRTIDRNTLEIRTHGAYPDLPAILAQSYFSIASPTAIVAGNETFDRAPVGSGPYRVATWTPGDEIVLEPVSHAGPGRFASVYVRDIVDVHTTVLALRKNDLDVVFGYPANFINEALTYRLHTEMDPVTGNYCAYAPIFPPSKRVCPPAASAHGSDAETTPP